MTKDKNDTTKQDTEAVLQEMEANWKRALADYRNLEKRFAEEKESLVKFANFVLISQLLPILDNLETLLKHNEDEGLKMITKEFHSVLDSAGVTEVTAKKGDSFDPMVMDAVENQSDSTAEGTVEEVTQKGYTLNGKLIRPARVIVR